ncbi:MAG: GPI anchored serine-threonine rich family protein, partial [Planctomycetaceae bacterium]|nr:GPI anchored serine-threonine rich family protein [Planctomycetaceae bacterium]
WGNGNETWIEVDQVAAASGAGSYNWNTTGVAGGTYYLAGYMWSGSKAYLSHLTQAITIQSVAAPAFTLTGPASGTFAAGATVSIQWTAANVPAGSVISLCYDKDAIWGNGNETWIEIDQVAAANGAGSYNWNTTGVAGGTYYLAGYLWSGTTPYLSHLTQAITIQAAAFALTGPTSGTFTAGAIVPIQWTAANVAAGSVISLCYDKDTLWGNGNETWIEIDQVAAANGAGSYNWNTTGVAAGVYYLAGYLWSSSTPYFSHLTQAITIAAGLMVGATTAPQDIASALTATQVTFLAVEASRRLEMELGNWATGALAGVNVELADLPGRLLGQTAAGTILIDHDAAGYGWFVAPTPQDDSEFMQRAANVLVAKPNPQTTAAGHADLLTTLTHEMGHVLGWRDGPAALPPSFEPRNACFYGIKPGFYPNWADIGELFRAEGRL